MKKNNNYPLVAAVILLVCTGLSTKAQLTVNPDNLPKWQSGRIYAKVINTSNEDLAAPTDAQIITTFASFGVTGATKPFDVFGTDDFARIYRISFPDTIPPDSLVAALRRSSLIQYAEKVPAIYPQIISNDPTQPYHLAFIRSDGASNIHSGGNAIVAVVDDAVLSTHQDLAGNVVSERDVADLDGDADPPVAGGAAVIFPGSRFSHGTHVAGIAGGVTNNATGIASIGWFNHIMAVKTRSSTDAGYGLPFAVDGVAWAAANGADVINMSFGGAAPSLTEYNVFSYAKNVLGVVLVAAAGNNANGTPFYPAAYGEGATGQPWELYDRKLVISVAALDQNHDRSVWGTGGLGQPTGSNFGYWVDIAAYGTDIISSVASSSGGAPINNLYLDYNGTSMAAPQVSGAAGLMRSYNPLYSPNDVYNCLVYAANPDIYDLTIHPGNIPGTLGYGRLDAQAALACMGAGCDTGIAVIFPSAQTICAGGSVTLTANSASSYLWGPGGETTQTINPATAGTYTVTVTFAGGCSASASIDITPAPTTVDISVIENSGLHPNDGILCGQDYVGLMASYGLSYHWNVFLATTQSINSINMGSLLPAQFTFAVTVTDVGGCPGVTGTDTVTVYWNLPPTASIVPGSAQICKGSSITLTAYGGTSYLWNNSAITQSISVNPIVNTNYTVTVTDINGCSASASRLVTVNQAANCCDGLQAHFTIEKDTLCTTDSIMITYGGGPYRRFLYPFPPYYSGIKPVLPPAGETKHEGVPPELAPGGTYTICCVIYSANPDSSAVWCSDTACIDITVINCCDSLRPVFDFIPAKDTLCVGDTIIIRLGGHGYGKWIDYQDGGSDPAYPISGNIYDTIVLGPEAVGGHDVCFVLYSANPDSTDVFCSDTICHHKEIIVCSCDSLVGKSKLAYNVPKDMLYDFYNAGGLQPSFIKWFIDGTEAGETTGDGHFPYLLQPGAHVICMRAAYVFPGENGHSLCCYDEVCDTLSVDSCEYWRATDYINYQRDPSNYHNVTFTYTGFTGDANYDLTMIWNFGDGSETVTNGLSPVSHTYPNDGFYNPCITLIWSRYGAVFNPDTPGVCCCVDTICLNLQIDPCNGNAFIIKEAAGPATTFMAVPVSPVTAIWYYWTANGVSSPMGLMPLFTYPVGFEDTICVTITYSFVNADGSKDTCKTQVCQVFSSGTPPAGLLRFFPNPANNFLAVEVMASVGEMSTIEITDYMGRPMITQRFENLTQGLNSLYLGIYDLPKGLYAMKVKVGSESKVVKFVKE